MKENYEVTLNPTDFGTLAICAIRYCHGRKTYMPSTVQGILKPLLSKLTDKDLYVMLNDCKSQNERPQLYGMLSIDLKDWEEWRKALEKEKERREREKA